MPAKKPAPAKKAAPAKKPAAKPAPAKKAAPAKKPAPKAAPKKPEKKAAPSANASYHLSKREDGKWAVRFAGGDKVIKTFATQKEGLEYCNKMAENQGGTVLVHASKGENKGRIKSK